jgi:hypothetical protein
MYNLYDVTGTESYLSTGKKFNHWQWTAPLAIGEDDIDASHGNSGGNHANTHIPVSLVKLTVFFADKTASILAE